MKQKIINLLLVLSAVLWTTSLISCTRSNATREVLEKAGYKQIEITGWRPFTCGDHDPFATGFKAVGPSGIPVTGAVCSGVFKGNTIRLD